MSRSSAPSAVDAMRPMVRYAIRGHPGPIQLSLLDHHLDLVATGAGSLFGEAPAGHYMIQAAAGGQRSETLCRLTPGESFSTEIDLRIPAATPVNQSANSHEYQSGPAHTLSLNPSTGKEHAARLMVFIRDPNHTINQSPPLHIDTQRLMLFDAQGHPIRLDNQIQSEPALGWAGFCIGLKPGGYELHLGYAGRHDLGVRLPLWLSRQWTTSVFLPWTRPLVNTDTPSPHPAPTGDWLTRALSVQYIRPEVGLNPGDVPRYFAELALAGLRSGQQLISDDILDAMLHGKFEEPMLGLIAAHLLLLRPTPPGELIAEVLNNLEMLLGEHPDVLALRLMARGISPRFSPEPPPIAWPPMLRPAYDALIRASLDRPQALEEASMADYAVEHLVEGGVWTLLEKTIEGMWVTPLELGHGFSVGDAEDDAAGHGAGAGMVLFDRDDLSIAASFRERVIHQVREMCRWRDKFSEHESPIVLRDVARSMRVSVGAVQRALKPLGGITPSLWGEQAANLNAEAMLPDHDDTPIVFIQEPDVDFADPPIAFTEFMVEDVAAQDAPESVIPDHAEHESELLEEAGSLSGYARPRDKHARPAHAAAGKARSRSTRRKKTAKKAAKKAPSGSRKKAAKKSMRKKRAKAPRKAAKQSPTKAPRKAAKKMKAKTPRKATKKARAAPRRKTSKKKR